MSATTHPEPAPAAPSTAPARLRRLGSVLVSAVAFLALAMSFGLVAPAYAATTVTTPAEVLNAFANGGSITLGNDITVTQTLWLHTGKTLTVDLGGHTLTVTGSSGGAGSPGAGSGAGGGGGGGGDAGIINQGTLVITDGILTVTGGTGGAGGTGGSPNGPGGSGGSGGDAILNMSTLATVGVTVTATGGAGGAAGAGGAGGTAGTPGGPGTDWAVIPGTTNNAAVMFDGNGADSSTTISIYADTVGDALALLPSAAPSWPVRTGYTFTGWFDAKSGGTAAAPAAAAAGQTLYAQWKINTYAVTFHNNTTTGSATSTATVDYGALVAQPAALTKAGYTFAGWFADPAATGTAWNFATGKVTGNLDLYAGWTQNPLAATGADVVPMSLAALALLLAGLALTGLGRRRTGARAEGPAC